MGSGLIGAVHLPNSFSHATGHMGAVNELLHILIHWLPFWPLTAKRLARTISTLHTYIIHTDSWSAVVSFHLVKICCAGMLSLRS